MKPPLNDSQEQRKVLSPEETEQVTQRLYYQQQEKMKRTEAERQATLAKFVPESKVLLPCDLEGHLTRVYSRQIERKKQAMDEAAAKLEAERPVVKQIPSSVVQDMIQRMYYTEQEKKAKGQYTLKKKYQPEAKTTHMAGDVLKASVERLAHADYDKREKELYEKHVLPQMPKTVKMSKDQLVQIADRLYKKQ